MRWVELAIHNAEPEDIVNNTEEEDGDRAEKHLSRAHTECNTAVSESH